VGSFNAPAGAHIGTGGSEGGDRADSIDGCQVGGMLLATAVPEPDSNRFARHNGFGRSDSTCVAGVQTRCHSCDKIAALAEQFGLTSQYRYGVALADLGHHRQELVANPVAAMDRVDVGRVVDRHHPKTRTQIVSLGAPKRQNWAVGGWLDAPKAVPAAPPKHREQYRLGLIIGGVAGQHSGRKGPVPCRTGSSFEVRARLHLDGDCLEPRSESRCSSRNNIRLGA
jgi:hypothetical protein